jgi:hypothetical protein
MPKESVMVAGEKNQARGVVLTPLISERKFPGYSSVPLKVGVSWLRKPKSAA